MSKKFNLVNSINVNKNAVLNRDYELGKLIENVQRDNVDLVRVNFEIEKSLRQKFKSKVSAEGRQIKDVLIELVKSYIDK